MEAPDYPMNNLNGKPKMTTRAKATFNHPVLVRWPVQYAVNGFVKPLGACA